MDQELGNLNVQTLAALLFSAVSRCDEQPLDLREDICHLCAATPGRGHVYP